MDDKETKAVAAEAKAKAVEDAKLAKVAADTEAKRLDALTFPERLAELVAEGYPVGREDATGQADGTNVYWQTENQPILIVIQDEIKYSVNIESFEKGEWYGRTGQVGTLLGVKFDEKISKKLLPTTPKDQLISDAELAARNAGGTFSPRK